jgi:hypothetical protein
LQYASSQRRAALHVAVDHARTASMHLINRMETLVKRIGMVRAAAVALALATPVISAYTPTTIVAKTVSAQASISLPKPQALFLSHILAITDVLNQCGNPSQSDVLQCPLVQYRSPGATELKLW